MRKALAALIVLAGLRGQWAQAVTEDEMARRSAVTAPVERPIPTEAADARAEGPQFDIMEYEVVGNTRLPQLEIEKAVYPYLGPGRSIADVEKARGALEKAYQKAGYLTVLVDIPEQKVEGGVVTLNVTEGKVGRVRVTGARYYSPGIIRDKAPALAPGQVPYFPAVQGQLAELNRGPDRRVTPVLKPGQVPGAVDAELKVQDRLPLHGGADLNNYYSPNTTRSRLNATVRYENLWQREHTLALSAQIAPQNISESLAFSASYLFRWPDSDTTIALYGVKSDSKVAAVGGVNVIGAGTILGARAIVPLKSPDSSYYHSVTFGIDHKDLDETLRVGNGTIDTPISFTPFLIQYSGTQVGKRGTTQFGVSLNFAMRVNWLSNSDAEFENKRFKANASYAYLRADISRTQLLPARWSVIAGVGGQWSDQPLVSSEQFAVGGVQTVRGYLWSELLGDSGIRGRLELRSPPFGIGAWAEEVYGLAFLDGAQVRVVDALPGQVSVSSISSSGLGLRMRAASNVSFTADLGYAFNETAYTRAGETRLQVSLAVEF